MDEETKNIAVGADDLIFHPYLNGELTPYANPKLCGSFVGVRASHTKGHFTRALLEGVAMSLLDCKNTLDKIGIYYDEYAVIIGGGSKSEIWRQIIADVLNIRLIVRKNGGSSLGSAVLAGIATGIFKDAEDVLNVCCNVVDEVMPIPGNVEKYREIFKKYKAIQNALEPIYNGEY